MMTFPIWWKVIIHSCSKPPSRIHVAHSWFILLPRCSHPRRKTGVLLPPKHLPCSEPQPESSSGFQGEDWSRHECQTAKYTYIYIYNYPNISSNVIAQVLQKHKWTLWSSSCTSAQYRKANVGQLRLQHHCQKKGHPKCAPLKRCLRNPSRSSQTWICLNTPRKGQKYMPYSP